MKTFLKPKGIEWALKQFIGAQALELMRVHDKRQLVKEVGLRFDIKEESFIKLLASKLDLHYRDDIEEVNAQINLLNFSVEELKHRGFVIYSAGLDSVNILCYDPAELHQIKLKTDKRKLTFTLSSWNVIEKLIDKIESSPMHNNQDLVSSVKTVDESMAWKVISHIIKNVQDGNGSSFEVSKNKKSINYAFVDSALLTRLGDIDYKIGVQLIEFLTELSFREPSTEKKLLGANYSLSFTALPAKGSVFVKFHRGELEAQEDERVYFTPPKRVYSSLH